MIDYYKTLNINFQASKSEIKKAYRMMALQYHPDKNEDSNTHQLFIEINQAYEILINTEKRKQYDYFYAKHILKSTSSSTKANEDKWKDSLNDTSEKAKSKAEKAAKNYNLFSKKVALYAGIYLLIEIVFSLLFGEIVNFGLLAGLGMTIGGVAVFSNFNTLNIIGGIILSLLGIILFIWNLKRISRQLNERSN